MDNDVLFMIQFILGVVLLCSCLHLYRVYIAPFATLQESYHFWRLRHCLKKCYQKDNPMNLSVDYRKKQQLHNVELTYGEILLSSFYQTMKKAKPKAHEVFYDLGSGAGKLVNSAPILFDLRAAKGIEIQTPLHQFSENILHNLKSLSKNDRAWTERLNKVTLVEGDILVADFSDADIIFINATCFQLEHWRELEDKFIDLKPGTRIIMTTKYLNEPHFRQLYTGDYAMSWGCARVSIFKRTHIDRVVESLLSH